MYSAHLNQVAVQKGVNRYYVVQALLVSGCPEVFCHWGATGCEELEELGGVKLKDNYKRYKCASAQDAIARARAAAAAGRCAAARARTSPCPPLLARPPPLSPRGPRRSV